MMTAITISVTGKYTRNQRLTDRPTRLRGASAGPLETLGTLGSVAPPHLGPQARGSVDIHDVNGGEIANVEAWNPRHPSGWRT